MKYHMIYPVDRWVSGADLIRTAKDAIENYRLIDEVHTVQDAIRILQDVGEVTIIDL